MNSHVNARPARSAAATAERILEAAIHEFAQNGFMGARIDAIAKRADANMRMLYHYFGSKEDLYLKVLEKVFGAIRSQEDQLNLVDLAPQEAMERLFDFTYRHFGSNPLFIRILTSENLMDAKHLHRSKVVQLLSSPLIAEMKEVLSKGEALGVFRSGIDALQLYVSIVALSYFHISNGPTLSWLFNSDMQSEDWRVTRKEHALNMLRAYLAPSRV